MTRTYRYNEDLPARTEPSAPMLPMGSLPPDELRDILARISSGCIQTRDDFLMVNYPLIIKIAKRIHGRRGTTLVTFNDVVAEAFCVALRLLPVMASQFDCSRGNKFLTYFYRCVASETVRSNAVNGCNLIRVPEHARTKHSKMAEARERAFGTCQLDMTAAESHKSAVAPQVVESEVCPDTDDRARILSLIRACVYLLPKRERLALEMRFGLNGKGAPSPTGNDEPYNLTDIAEKLGVKSKERIRQLLRRAVRQIRWCLPPSILDAFWGCDSEGGEFCKVVDDLTIADMDWMTDLYVRGYPPLTLSRMFMLDEEDIKIIASRRITSRVQKALKKAKKTPRQIREENAYEAWQEAKQ